MSSEDQGSMNISTGGGAIVEGDVHAKGDFIGRDKITYVTNQIHQRALTAVEEAVKDKKLESKILAEGVEQIAARLSDLASDEEDSLQSGPYRGLLEYRLADSEIFLGREKAIKELWTRIQRGRLTVVHSESGSGKTSLLNAGIAPRIIVSGGLPLLLRPYDQNPVLSVKLAFVHDLEDTLKLKLTSLRDFLGRVCSVLGKDHRLYILLDQFEEFFTRLDPEQRQDFVQELASCLEDESLAVHWVLALRSEYFSDLAAFQPRIRNPFENEYRLNRLTREETTAVIVEPLKRFGKSYEPGLVEKILNDLGRNDPEVKIAPPEVQLVCSTLYNALPENQDVITHALYEEEGCAEGILRSHLGRVLQKEFKPDLRQSARRVLEALVSSDQKRKVLNQAELDKELASQGISSEDRSDLIRRLLDSRLLRSVEYDAGASFELAHDYLLGEIQLDPAVQARKAAQELLLQEETAYKRTGSLIAAERMAVIKQFMGEMRVTPEQQALVERSQDAIDRQADAVEKQRQRELQQAQNLARTQRQRSLIFAGGAVISLILLVVAILFLNRAEQQANTALARQLAAQAQMILNDSPAQFAKSALLAIESLNRKRELPASLLLSEILGYRSREVASINNNSMEYAVVASSPDGKLVALAGDDGNVLVWDAGTREEIARLTHETSVDVISFSPDGKWIVSGSADNITRIWDIATGREVARMTHESFVYAIALSRDGQRVASGSEDGGILVWEAATGRELARMEHDGEVLAVSFSPDGKWIASGSWDGTARLWDASSGNEVIRVDQGDSVDFVAFSPDGKLVVSGGYFSTAIVWEAASGKEVSRLKGEGIAIPVKFSPDGEWLLSAIDDAAIVWETATGEEFTRKKFAVPVSAVAFSPDGQRVISGSEDGTVILWQTLSGYEEARISHEGRVSHVAFNPQGTRVLSASEEGTVLTWEVAPGQEVLHTSFDDIVYSFDMSPDSKWLVTGNWNGDVRVVEAATGLETAHMAHDVMVYDPALSPDGQQVSSGSEDGSTEVLVAAPTVVTSAVYDLAFSTDSKLVVSGSEDGSARVWDAATGKEVSRVDHGTAVSAVAFSPDGKWVASGSRDGSLKVWDATTEVEISRRMVNESEVSILAFSRDGKWILSGSFMSGILYVWEAATGHEVASMNHESTVNSADFSPDGRRVVSSSGNGIFYVWEAGTGKEVARMASGGNVYSVAFSPDGKLLASGGNDGTVQVWEAATGKELRSMAHGKEVYSVSFSPDGKYILSGSADNTARVWEAATGQEVSRIAFLFGVSRASFSPDGKWIMSNTMDGIVHISWWNPDDLVRLVCERLPRNLTQDEWSQYLEGEPYRQTCPNPPPGE